MNNKAKVGSITRTPTGFSVSTKGTKGSAYRPKSVVSKRTDAFNKGIPAKIDVRKPHEEEDGSCEEMPTSKRG